MDSLQFEIARFLALKAAMRQRTTYQQVGEAVGWNHPNGRGLGAHLEVILHYLADKAPKLPTQLSKLWIARDLPLNFHPAATGARFVFTPIGAG